MIVVDLGCYDWGGVPSLSTLAAEYKPELIYGFDPNPRLDTSVTEIAGIPTRLVRAAAWLYDGEVAYTDAGTGSMVGSGYLMVPCFDLCAWLKDLGERVVLKMDIEGGEYELLPRLVETGADSLIDELLIEWHGEPVLPQLSCTVREWWM